jgi:hypothetical protein
MENATLSFPRSQLLMISTKVRPWFAALAAILTIVGASSAATENLGEILRVGWAYGPRIQRVVADY